MVVFLQELEEFWAVHQLLTKLVYDLTYCATADLMPLLEIPGVKQVRQGKTQYYGTLPKEISLYIIYNTL